MYTPRVLIIDKALDEFSALLRAAPSLSVAGETQTATQALALAEKLQPDVILLNVDTLRTEDVELVACLDQLYPHLKLMLINADHTPDDMILEAYRQGVRACLLKAHNTLAEIVEAVHALYRGEAILSPQMAGEILDEVNRSLQKSGAG